MCEYKTLNVKKKNKEEEEAVNTNTQSIFLSNVNTLNNILCREQAISRNL